MKTKRKQSSTRTRARLNEPPLQMRQLVSEFLPRCFTYAKSQGVATADLERLFQSKGQPENTVRGTYEKMRECLDTLSERLNDEHLGLRVAVQNLAQPLSVNEHASLYLLMIQSASCLNEMAELTERYSTLLSPWFEPRLERGIDAASFHVNESSYAGGCGRHYHEYSLSLAVAMARKLLGHRFELRGLFFANSKPSKTEILRAHFRTDKIVFNANTTGYWQSMRDWFAPLPTANAETVIALRRAADKLMGPHPFRAFVRTRARDHVRRNIHKVCSVATVGRALGMSARTLQRKLKEEGTSTESIVEEERKRAALLLLAEPKKSVAEVGYDIGYAQSQTFIRAFKRWYKVTPASYRKTLPTG